MASGSSAVLGPGVAPAVGVLLAVGANGVTLAWAAEAEAEPDGVTLAWAAEAKPDGVTFAGVGDELLPQAAIPTAGSSITASNAVMLLFGANPARIRAENCMELPNGAVNDPGDDLYGFELTGVGDRLTATPVNR